MADEWATPAKSTVHVAKSVDGPIIGTDDRGRAVIVAGDGTVLALDDLMS